MLNCNDVSRMKSWETRSSDLARIIESFETQTATDFDVKEKPHREDTLAFQSRFPSDVTFLRDSCYLNKIVS